MSAESSGLFTLKEINRIKIRQDVIDRRTTSGRAAELLGVTPRHCSSRSSMYMRVSQRQNSQHLNTLISITQFRLALPISSAIPNDFYQAKIRLMRPLLLSSILKWRPKLWCISSVIPRAPFYPFKNTLEAVMQVEHPFMRIEINYLPLKIVARFTCLLGNNHSE